VGFLFFKKKKKKNEAEAVNDKVEESLDENVKPQVEENQVQLEDDEIELTPRQKEKQEKLKSLEGKISKILQSNNIEIVDENAGDEYDTDDSQTDSDKKKQQDYESLKDLFGKDSNKQQEVTLTIDDFDYTYVGKYVDEYDLIHMKHIKRIKLQNKHKKLIKRLIIAGVFVLALSIGGILTYNILKETPVYLQNVYLTQTSQSYFRDESFDYTGIYIVEEYSDGQLVYSKLGAGNLQSTIGYVEGFGGNIKFTGGNVATLYFQHKGFTNIEFIVTVMEKTENGLTSKYTEGLFSLKANDYITSKQMLNLIEYSNYNAQRLTFSNQDLHITVDGVELSYDKDNEGFRVVNDITTDSEIVVRYKNYSVTLDSSKYSVTSVVEPTPAPTPTPTPTPEVTE